MSGTTTSPITATTPSSSSTGSSRRWNAVREAAGAALLAAVGIGLRLLGADGRPDDWDGIDFVLALDEFDLSRFQPHFPGYPVYLAPAKLLVLLGAAPGTALAWVGAAAGGLTPLLALFALRRRAPAAAAWSAAALLAVQPALVFHSGRLSSDACGLFLLALALTLLDRGRFTAAGAAMGLLLGARLSYFPFLAALALPFLRPVPDRTRKAAAALGGVFLGTAAWLLPLVGLAGADLLGEGAAFIGGHFGDWGGTPFSPGAASGRWARWTSSLALEVAGGWPPGPLLRAGVVAAGVLVLGGLILFLRRSSGKGPEAVLAAAVLLGPYILWLFLGQNPRHDRHLLPLAAAAACVSACGWHGVRDGGRYGWPACLSLGMVWLILSVEAQAARRETSAPGDALAAYLEHAAGGTLSGGEPVFCGESWRFLRWRGQDRLRPVARARDFEGVLRELNSQLSVPQRVLVSSEVAGLPPGSRPLASFSRPGFLGEERLEIHLFRTVVSPPGAVELVVEGGG